MPISIENFNNSDAKLYRLNNESGMELVLSNIGASIINIFIEKDGKLIDVVLGYKNYEGYKINPEYQGVTVGRCANRIAKASFDLEGITYNLDKNDRGNTLHNGFNGYTTRLWDIEEPDLSKNSLTFKLKSADGDQNMPGNANIYAHYELTKDNKIIVYYYALSDKTTLFNIVNHSYFNLGGHNSGDICSHLLKLNCDSFLATDTNLIPTGEIVSVNSTPMDFRVAKPIGQDINANYNYLKAAGGYDHNFIINNDSLLNPLANSLTQQSTQRNINDSSLPNPSITAQPAQKSINKPSLINPFAILYSPETKIEMSVYTNQPGVQIYTANSMPTDNISYKQDAKYPKHAGICLETQGFPDAIHYKSFPSIVYKANQLFESKTIYEFKF
jgi:aldose 1-epimerase